MEKIVRTNTVKKVFNIITIDAVRAREILDSRGNPTIEVDVICSNGMIGTASVPSGASTGEREAIEIRDKDDKRFLGKGVLTAIYNVNSILGPNLKGMDVTKQADVDRKLIELDGTKNKSRYGANAILGISLACLKAGARVKNKPLYQYIGDGRVLPKLFINVINGGAHADNNIEFQEFMIMPINKTVADRVRMGSEVFHTLKGLLKEKSMSTAVGDEGGFAPNLPNAEVALDLIVLSIEKSGYKDKVKIALDVAASYFFDKQTKKYKIQGMMLSTDELCKYYEKLREKYPIISIEDPFDENDWQGFTTITQKIGYNTQIVGDDLLVTNKELLEKAITNKSVNTILIKPNQIGTYTEMLDTINLAKKSDIATMMSHRSGETTDTYIADIAVGLSLGEIKTGSMSRGERICKYNRLMKIESSITHAIVNAPTPKTSIIDRAIGIFDR